MRMLAVSLQLGHELESETLVGFDILAHFVGTPSLCDHEESVDLIP